ncbi:MAG: PAS domain S-box protein [Gemmatimonadetes bacterium]|nr:PAS domain S-box protein [Gemmatimonadota bacterium]
MRQRVLVVEDSQTQAEQLRLLLESEAYPAVVARNGEEALARMAEESVDLVLSDVVMPGIDGYELCRRIKQRHEVPVVLLTSLTDPVAIVRGLEAGADNYITKPYDPVQLIARIRRALDGGRIRRDQRTSMGVHIAFLGSRFTITSEKEQILDLLLSSVEDIVRANRALEERQRELAEAHARLEASAREAAREARLSNERARVLMQSAKDGIFLLDDMHTIVELNDSAAVMLGFPAEEILYRPFERFISPEAVPELAAGRRAPSLEEQALRDWTLVRPDGTEICVELSASTTRLDGEEVALVVARDVTDRKQAEEAIRESNERFRQLAENIPQVFWMSTPNGAELLYVSPSFERIFGQLPDALGAEPIWRHAVHADDRECVLEAMAGVAEAPCEANYRIVKPDGEARWIHGRTFPVRDERGDVVRIAGVLEDVTAHVEAQRALEHSEEYWRALVEYSADLIFILDADASITYAGPSIRQVLGYSAEELVGTNVLEPVHPDDLAEARRALAEVLERPGALVTTEVRYRHRDGSWRSLVALARSLLDHPAVGGIVVNCRDVTEQRRAEEQFRQAQKMEAIGQLAGGIAHDFNNLLTAIRGFAMLAGNDLDAGHPAREHLDEVVRSADTAAALTQQLLAFSRRQVLRPQVLDPNDVIAESVNMLRRLVGENVRIHVRAAPDLGRVLVDRGQLQQVLMNLVVNARDAMPAGGTITVETMNAEIVGDGSASPDSGAHPGRFVRIAVSDTGVGIPREIAARIFEPFFTTKEPGRGTGLGLSTVYGIVQQSGGQMSFDSEPGRGTTFTIHLPRVDAPPATRPQPPSPAPAGAGAGQGRTVLLIEDDASVRTFARRVLERAGYAVIPAGSGPEALRIIESHAGRIDAVVTDLVMPGMSSADLARELTRAIPDTPVIFTSGYAKGDATAGDGLPADVRFLEKPYVPADLTRLLHEVLMQA